MAAIKYYREYLDGRVIVELTYDPTTRTLLESEVSDWNGNEVKCAEGYIERALDEFEFETDLYGKV